MPKQIVISELTPYEIIMAMVNGLRKRWVKVDMSTFGKVKVTPFLRRKICYGCAATNALCELRGGTFLPSEIDNRDESLKVSNRQLNHLELAIDLIRCGSINRANDHLAMLGIKPIKIADSYTSMSLPVLNNDYTPEKLDVYEALAKYQLQIEITTVYSKGAKKIAEEIEAKQKLPEVFQQKD